MKKLVLTWVAVLVAVALAPVPAQAAQIAGISVIGGGVTFGPADYNTGSFPASKVLDQQTGSISEPIQDGYWLLPDSTPGYFVLDLGAPYYLSEIDLFNTHNSFNVDRFTLAFRLRASNNAVFNSPSLGDALSGTVDLIASGTLTLNQFNPLVSDVYSLGNSNLNVGANSYRYLEFDADTWFASGGGLNEIRAFGSLTPPVPEPSTLALAGLGLTLFAGRRRARR